MGLREKLSGELLWTPNLAVYGEVGARLSLCAFGVGWLWKSIKKGWEAFLGFSRFEVGDGVRAKFWHDLWCGDTVLKKAFPVLFGMLVRRMALLRIIWSSWVVSISGS
jgi:hypothetical protein